MPKFHLLAPSNQCFVALDQFLEVAGGKLIVELNAPFLSHFLDQHVKGIVLIF